MCALYTDYSLGKKLQRTLLIVDLAEIDRFYEEWDTKTAAEIKKELRSRERSQSTSHKRIDSVHAFY